jgi:hypothetical protein
MNNPLLHHQPIFGLLLNTVYSILNNWVGLLSYAESLIVFILNIRRGDALSV